MGLYVYDVVNIYICEWNTVHYDDHVIRTEQKPFLILANSEKKAISKAYEYMLQHYDNFEYNVYEYKDMEVIS